MADLLLIAIFDCHLLAVDLAMAGPLVSIWLEWRETRRGDALAGQIGRRLAVWSLVAAAVGSGLGLVTVVVLPQIESAAYRAALDRVSSYRWWSVAGEMAFYFACMAAYVLLWRRLQRHRLWHRLLAVLAATNLIYHFPPLFTIISTLSMRPDLNNLLLDRSLYWNLLLEGETLSRVVHHWLAAIAVAGTTAMLLAARKASDSDFGELSRTGLGTRDSERGTADTVVRQGAKIALAATLIQLPVGVWVLFEMPAAVQSQLLGEDLTATLMFGVSVVAALGLMHHLAMVSLGEVSRRAVYRTALLMVAVVFLMVATLHRARQVVLVPMKVTTISLTPNLDNAVHYAR